MKVLWKYNIKNYESSLNKCNFMIFLSKKFENEKKIQQIFIKQ